MQNASWVRSQLLFFDEISTIDPMRGPTTGISSDEAVLLEAGAVSRVKPTSGAVERASRQMAMLLLMARERAIRSHFAGSEMHRPHMQSALSELRSLVPDNRGGSLRTLSPRIVNLEEQLKERMSDRYVRMHPEKMEWVLRDFLNGGSGESSVSTEEWVEVDPVFASVYMAVLAHELTKESDLSDCSVLTDNPIYDLLHQDITATSNVSQQMVRRAEGIFVDLVLPYQVISPENSIGDILKFKKKYDSELKHFRREIQSLALQCAALGTLQEIRNEAERIVRRRIQPAVSELESALSGYGIVWNRAGALKASSLVAGLAAGLATFDFTGSHYFALSSSVAISFTGFGLSGYGDRRSLKDGSPYAYLLEINKNFCG
jgi:hypothetical protein